MDVLKFLYAEFDFSSAYRDLYSNMHVSTNGNFLKCYQYIFRKCLTKKGTEFLKPIKNGAFLR